ncbi:inter-alpha-trypsin inhibitor heavy chain H4-like isoform X2 [Myotis myotis]|uniref:Inter-alpha-trypsin inhibitor heavy chain 4 n=1 Tax=Myotis myotis TaxID=51298 RepID=A0A7J7UCJ1_MYOMY|nr:inter-alpha-trypsin inhibitor heavy chain H4-like isoform X2 [Myotis myotis]KAF6310589.1 inter-alpha-trypsin inhibitor heavy chain 4 [Myotis myotis]
MKPPGPARVGAIVLVLLSLLAVLQTTCAQKNAIDIYSLTVDSRVSSRFAHTVITSRVVNRADSIQEATFQMELPKKAFITNFSMIIDGVTYPGNIKQKDAAQQQYSAAVARGESAGLVKATGRKMEQFQVSVSVAPAAKVTFELVYEELLMRRLGVYELLLKVQPQQLVKHLQMDIHIFEPQGISFLETESTFMTNELADALTVSQNQTKAHIRFKPTLSQQQKPAGQQDTVVDGDFIIRYDVNRTLSGGSIQIENGYFVHYFAPEGLSTIPKNVIFVIDTSGSMMGKKIQQTREALIKILEDLRPEDHFNLISFSSEASQWKPLLVPASTQNVEEAKKYANSIQARGGTNINNAMLMAVQLLDTATREEQLPLGSVSLLLLLTDGDPTVGETNPKKIQKNVKEAIGGQYSLFCLGFGFDVSYAFLEKLALDNGGLARRIYEDSDSALQLQDFYQEVANPLLTTVSFEYPGNAVEEVTQDNFPLFFKGSEMVVAGKLRAQSPDVLSATVSGQLPTENITFQMESQVAKQEEEFQKPKYIFHGFMERLWAYLTIHQLLERMVSTSDAEKQALETQALGLSLNYSFVTPLTSMVVTKPEGQEQSQVAEKPVENGRTVFRHRAMGHKRPRLPGGVALHDGGHDVPNRKSGRSGPLIPFYEKLMSERNPDVGLLSGIVGDYLDETMEETSPTAPPPAPIQAPTFILPLPGQSVDQLCVDIKSTPGPLLLLLSDPDQGLEVTGEYKMEKAQFSWIEVTFKNPQLQVHVSPEHVVVTRDRRSSQYKWKETLFMVMPGLKMTMDKAGLLLFSSPDRVTIGLLSWDGPGQGLRLLLRDTDRFSSHVGGLLGRFYQGVAWGPPDATDDSKRTLWTRGFEFNATRKLKLDYQEGTPGTELSCWSIEL